MDIKLKKCKLLVGFLSFFIGLSLLVNVLAAGLGMYCDGYYRKTSYGGVFEKDYQNTLDFKRRVSSSLQTFLTMATNGPLWSYHNYNSSYDREYGYDSNNVMTGIGIVEDGPDAQAEWELEMLEDQLLSQDAIYQEYGSYADAEDHGYPEPSPEENRKAAQALDKLLQEDKNLLYIVTFDGKTVYSNTEEGTINQESGHLPDGYNFMLYFDGTETRIIKDGTEQNVYGSGYYEDNSDWHVPGYKNFTVDEKCSRVTVRMAAAKEPKLYVTGNYSSRSNNHQTGDFYWIQYNLDKLQKRMVSMGIELAAAVCFLVIYILLRKQKKQVDMKISAFTGKLWFEAKLVLLILAAGGLFFGSPYVVRELIYAREIFYSGQILYLLRELLRNSISVLVLFWTSYLYIIDLRYNRKTWKRGIVASIYRIFDTGAIKQPAQKRMIHRYVPVLVAELILFVAGVAMFMVSYGGGYGALRGTSFYLTVVIAVSLAAQMFFMKRNKMMLEDVGSIFSQIKSIREGNLYDGISLAENSGLKKEADDLNSIQQGMSVAVDDRLKSERMKVELVSNVSHDIKTPLTSIMSYVELLNQEEELPEHVREYVKILEEKSERLKAMVQDVFEVSKAASGQLSVNCEALDLGKLIRQTLADMDERIQTSGLIFKTVITEEPVMIEADGQRLYRVFQNLIQNALKYSLQASRIYVTLEITSDTARVSVKNTSESEIADQLDFTERFIRGDESRTDGGSGLGLSIAKSFTEACNGSFELETIADLFVVTVGFTMLR